MQSWDNKNVIRWHTAGESHGPALIALIEGVPAGVQITTEIIQDELARRRLGYGRGARMRFEKDAVRIISGVRFGRTLGSPIAIEINNTEWPKWEQVMSADPLDPALIANSARGAALTRPRPGHADLTGMLKYGHSDARPVLERASARETAARVAVGAVMKQFLTQVADIKILSHVLSIGASQLFATPIPAVVELEKIDASPVRAANGQAEAAMIAELEAAKSDGDTLGGVFEVIAENVPPGLGTYVDHENKLDAQIAAAFMGINAIKGVEIGDGFITARRRGSAAHDEIIATAGVASRLTNHAGGIEGGMSNGEKIIVHAAMKPISTVPKALRTIDIDTGEAAVAIHQRSDICAVPAAGVIGESMLAIVLATAFIAKFGGDSLIETQQNYSHYMDRIRAHPGFVDSSLRDSLSQQTKHIPELPEADSHIPVDIMEHLS